jgi:voltage-gated potassium channel
MMGRWIVEVSYFLQSSHPYRKVKNSVYNLLENNRYPYKRIFDIFMIGLIFLSVYILIRQVKHELSDGWVFFNNYVITFIFLSEYLLRLWVYSDSSKIIIEQYEHDLFLHRPFSLMRGLKATFLKKFEFIRSPSAIIDLLAILPFFHELRILRVFILFRVLKIFRYAQSLRRLISILSAKKFEFITLIIFTLIVIFIASVLIYVMEANHPKSPLDTLFDALYWSVVTIFTVGYGDITPVTSGGRMVAMAVIVLGIAVISFATSIVVSAFTEKLDEIKEEKLIDDVNHLKRFYLICGFSMLSLEVIKKLHKGKTPVVILEKDPLLVAQGRNHGLLVLEYDPASMESYTHLKINFAHQIEAILLLHESDVANIFTALTIREMTKHVPLYSILYHLEHRRKLQMAGIDVIINPQELVGLMGKILSTQPVALEAIHALRSEHTSTVIDEIVLQKGMEKTFFTLLEEALFLRRLNVLGIFYHGDKNFHFNPNGSEGFNEGDVAIVLANPALLNAFKTELYRRSV